MRSLVLTFMSLLLSVVAYSQTLFMFGEDLEAYGEKLTIPQAYFINFDSKVFEQRILAGNYDVNTSLVIEATIEERGGLVKIVVTHVGMDAEVGVVDILLDPNSTWFGLRIGGFYLQGNYRIEGGL